MAARLVFIGGGHAHMAILANMRAMVGQGHLVTLVAPSRYHYYSGMGPGMLGGTYRPDQIRFDTRKVVEKAGAIFIRNRAVKICPREKTVRLQSGPKIPYDLLCCNAGSYVPSDIATRPDKAVFTVKPIEGLLKLQSEITAKTARARIQISVLGGGPSAAEIAANIRQWVEAQGGIIPEIRIHAGNGFMSRFPQAVRRKAISILIKRNIIILEGDKVNAIGRNSLETEAGYRHDFDLAIIATGIRPSGLFAASGLATGPDGGLKVNRFLQSVQYPEIFGGGDCIYFAPRPLAKAGVYAVRQSPILLHNIMAMAVGRPLKPFIPQKDYLIILNLAGKTGLLHKGPFTFSGKPAFRIKDIIDRRFMARYKALET